MGQDYIKGGGTSSAADDQRQAMLKADAQKRRNHQDEVKRIAKADPVHAKLYSRNLGGISSNASIVLKVVPPKRPTGYIACDLIAEEHDGAPGFLLVMICPRCYYERQVGAQLAHITLRSWHRGFSLDSKLAGELWVSPINNKEGEPPEAYTLAGSIHTHEVQTCPTCALRFEIGPARLDANEPPCSGEIRYA